MYDSEYEEEYVKSNILPLFGIHDPESQCGRSVILDKIRPIHEMLIDKWHVADDHKLDPQIYGITITFNDEKKYKKITFGNMDDYARSYVFHGHMLDYAFKRPQVKFVIYPEYDQNGRLHYHGVVYGVYQSEFKKLVHGLKRKFGFCKIELEIKHIEEWLKYISKDTKKSGLPFVFNT